MLRLESLVPLPERADTQRLTDWCESALVIEKRQRLTRSLLRERVDALNLTGGVDERVENVLGEVRRRQAIGGDGYPFRKIDGGFERDQSRDGTCYEFLLWLSISPKYREENRFDEIDELFDRVVRQALVSYMGPTSEAVRFAYPSSDGRPQNFPEALRWMADLLNMTLGSLEPRSQVKDGGADVIAWRPFTDGRAGYATVICQCTAQLNWPPKAKDIVPSLWTGWIGFGAHPMTALAVPFSIGPSFDRWDEVRYTTNILLERLRLCQLLNAVELDDDVEIARWNESERALLTKVYEL